MQCHSFSSTRLAHQKSRQNFLQFGFSDEEKQYIVGNIISWQHQKKTGLPVVYQAKEEFTLRGQLAWVPGQKVYHLQCLAQQVYIANVVRTKALRYGGLFTREGFFAGFKESFRQLLGMDETVGLGEIIAGERNSGYAQAPEYNVMLKNLSCDVAQRLRLDWEKL